MIKKLNGEFTSLEIKLFTRSIAIKDLVWQSPNTQYPHVIKLSGVRLQGISLFQLFLNRTIDAEKLVLDSGSISINAALKSDTVRSASGNPYSLEIKHIIIRNVETELKQDSLMEMKALLTVSYGTLIINVPGKLFESLKSGFRYVKGSIEQAQLRKINSFYTIKSDRLIFDSDNKSFGSDSLKLIPNYSKYEFAKKLGRQTDRVDLQVDQIEFKGLNFPDLFDSLISIDKISIHAAKLHAFRDKRVTDRNVAVIPMPMATLAKLPFGIEIDSIAIANSTITVEELGAEAFQSGQINFQHLQALMVGLTNRYYSNKPQFAELNANAKVMGSGAITASFRFPVDGSPMYSAKGLITNLPLQDLNSILENSARIKIVSGKLNELHFNFNYSDTKSTGIIEISYDDLVMSRLNLGKEKSTNFLKTFLLNSFVKTNKNKTTEQAERLGTIDVLRDQQRFIFNYWWKSLQSGLKASVMGSPDAPPQWR